MALSVVVIAVGLVFLGCCANVIFLELLIKEEPSSGNIITFFQFLIIAVEGAIFTTHFGCKKSHIPIPRYFILVTFFFVVSVLNNYSLGFNIPLPLHMIFRAGSLMANMVLGIILLKKRYPVSKYIAVVIITMGISMATIASARQGGEAGNDDNGENGAQHYFKISFGIALLLLALFSSARMGIYQETLYKSCGKHPREAMFYMHALPLPGFLLLASDIWSKCISFTSSAPLFSLAGVGLPKMWVYIAGNCMTQYVCIRGVFVLTTECPSLVVTLVITLRKFVSLLFSIFYFENPFTTYHWVATAMVFGGTALFTGLFESVFGLLAARKPQKTD